MMRRLVAAKRDISHLAGGLDDYMLTRIREEADGFNTLNGRDWISILNGRLIFKVQVPDDIPSSENIIATGKATIFLAGKAISIRQNIISDLTNMPIRRSVILNELDEDNDAPFEQVAPAP